MEVVWEGGCWHWHYIPEWIVLSLHLLLLTFCSFIIFHEPHNVLFNVLGQRETWEKNKLIMKRIGPGRERRRKNLVWGSTANRSGGPFEVYCFSAVNSLRTCVIFWMQGQLGLFPTWKCQISPHCCPLSHCGPWKGYVSSQEKHPSVPQVVTSVKIVHDREIIL